MLSCFEWPQPAGHSREHTPPRDQHTMIHCAKADKYFHRRCAAGATHDELGALELLQDQGLHGDGAQVRLPHRELAARLVRQHPPQLDGAPRLRLGDIGTIYGLEMGRNGKVICAPAPSPA